MRYIRESEVPHIERRIFAEGVNNDPAVAERFNISLEDVDRIRRWAIKRSQGSLENPTEFGDGGGTDDGTRFE